MDENVSIQTEQKIENNQNNFLSFNIHKKLAILIFAGLLFLAFGVGAFYVGQQSVINKIEVIPTPTFIISPILTPTNLPTIQPQPTLSKINSPDCQIDTDCPRAYASYGQRCINGKCVMDDDRREEQPSPTQKATYQTQSSCVSDSDCVIKDTPYCCGTKKEYYKWCYSAGENPQDVSCTNNGSCPGIVGSATSCICQNNVCTAVL